MSTEQTWQTESSSLEATLSVGVAIGHRLRGGEVIELLSDLGGGKTAFVRGLAKGMGSNEQVHSPSFTIANQYRATDLTLHHLDFYRLREAGIMKDELAELLNDSQSVIAVEWAGLIEAVLPAERLTVRITVTGQSARELRFNYPETLSYLFPNVLIPTKTSP